MGRKRHMKHSESEKPERYIVSAYYSDGWGLIDDWTRVYKTRSRAEKRFRELVEDYEVIAEIHAWYPDFSKSKAGKFVLIKRGKPRKA